MKRVTGIGGVFFQAKDPVALRAWHQRHLGIAVQPWGGTAIWSIGAAAARRHRSAQAGGAMPPGNRAPAGLAAV